MHENEVSHTPTLRMSFMKKEYERAFYDSTIRDLMQKEKEIDSLKDRLRDKAEEELCPKGPRLNILFEGGNTHYGPG